ncbi:hypothetical protein BpHYR1_003200 [Brachionus plicatilis]|uniref:Uncharacterized protein n=1 Tax=Brachionus plicatilis TaxID=10195 RepID=A0A3M7PUX5_BRAPC|nr:hypothetical protein BpHYR1_003200 [Brachionus plicatilis]
MSTFLPGYILKGLFVQYFMSISLIYYISESLNKGSAPDLYKKENLTNDDEFNSQNYTLKQLKLKTSQNKLKKIKNLLFSYYYFQTGTTFRYLHRHVFFHRRKT